MTKKILIAIVLFVEFYILRIWFTCQSFADYFHFSPLDMRLKLEEATHNDIGFPTHLARFFHNKVAFFVNQVFINYLHFWDIRLGMMLFSIVGYFGIFCGFWYLIRGKSKFKWFVVAALLILPLIEVLRITRTYQINLLLLTLPYQIFSLFGLWKYMKAHGRKAIAIVFLLIIISVWYHVVLRSDIFLNCYKR